MTLPMSVQIPRSALCEYGDHRFEGHRVKILYSGIKSLRRQICSKCKRDIVHDGDLGTYVTPCLIEEDPI